MPVEDGLALEADLITRCFASEDGQHGLRSFVDQGRGRQPSSAVDVPRAPRLIRLTSQL